MAGERRGREQLPLYEAVALVQVGLYRSTGLVQLVPPCSHPCARGLHPPSVIRLQGFERPLARTMRYPMSRRRSLLLSLLLSTLTVLACARSPAPVDLLRPGITEAEVVERLGPPGLITEQPRALVQVPTPTGSEFREKRRATWYYPGPVQSLDRLVTFEDGVVVDTGQRAR